MEEISYKFVTTDNLTTLRPYWNSILDSNPNHSFIHCYHWYSSYLESHEKESSNALFLFIEYQKQPIAICPLQYVSKQIFGINIKIWRIFWPGDMGLNDFIIAKDHTRPDVLNTLIKSLNKKHSKTWHVLELQNASDSSNISTNLIQTKISRLISVYHHDSKYIACQPSYEESIANISGKFKRNNRRKLRKLEKFGSVTFSLVDSGAELDQAYQNFLKTEAANWKGKENSAISQNIKNQKFYDRLKDNFSETHRCLIHTLHLNNEPIASQFILHCGKTIFLLKIGYDEQYAAMGPGTLLLNETIRRFSGDANIKKISFVTGAKWNDDWSPRVNKVYNYYIYNSNPIGLSIYLFYSAKALGRIIKWKLKHYQ